LVSRGGEHTLAPQSPKKNIAGNTRRQHEIEGLWNRVWLPNQPFAARHVAAFTPVDNARE